MSSSLPGIMQLSLPLVIGLTAFFLVIEGLFSGSEIALLSADQMHLKRLAKTSRGSRLALDLAQRPEKVFSTTLFVSSICVIAITFLITFYLNSTSLHSSELLSILICSPLIVIFGELLPKSAFQRYANRLAPFSAFPVTFAYHVFFPFTRLMSGYTNRLSKVIGPVEELLSGKRRTTREQLEMLLNYTRKESELSGSERRMIKRILDFKDSEAKHALIPLVRVEALEAHTRVQDALKRFEIHRHSRMPVYEGRIDNVIGVIEYRDLFAATDLNQTLHHFVSPAHYVAETQALLDVLIEMRTQDDKMVVVVDEHGGAVGVLTFEDIVEEIVGEIQDEYDSENPGVKELTPNRWLIQARTEIQTLNESLKLSIPEGEYETLAGFLLQQFGRIPETRDELFFNTPAANLKFVIQRATERQIESVLIERMDLDRPSSN